MIMVEKKTKKSLAAEKSALKSFDNMIAGITAVTPEFIQTNIEALNRVPLSEAGKKHVAVSAEAVRMRAETNMKIRLPKEWASLLAYDQ
jgi:hypothetical protein